MSSDEFRRRESIVHMTGELRSGDGYHVHVFHHGRLLSKGMDEAEVVKLILATAIVLESVYDKGIRLTPEQIETVYKQLPGSGPRKFLKKLLGA